MSRRDKDAPDSAPSESSGTWRYKKVNSGSPGDAIARENSQSVLSQLHTQMLCISMA